ncbi:MAG: RNA polymerase sigma factor [Gammaproteobacteria bacterium]|nr:RNA polymerase sigma factor [Gammaproteobacteria bacterium]
MNDKMVTDNALLTRFAVDGDESAFKELVSRHQKALFQFVWKRIGHESDALDLVQKVFIQVFSKAEQFRGDANFKTWLYQIAINHCKNHYRSKERQRIDDVEIDDLKLQSDTNTQEEIEDIEQKRILNKAIMKLPDKQRLTLELHLYQGHTFPEVAEILGCAVGTAKANYHHAIITMKNILGG